MGYLCGIPRLSAAGTGNESLAECAENAEWFWLGEFNLSVGIGVIRG